MQGHPILFPSATVLPRPASFKGGGYPRSPRVPQEVTDLIIDEAGNAYDRATLAACSLTCRDWVHRSRVHIHAAVRIDSTSNLDHLTQLYSSDLAHYVRSLSIDACNIEGDGMPSPHPWLDKASPLLLRLTKIERLSLDAIVWADLSSEIQTILLTLYKQVKDIWLSTCEFGNSDDLIRLLQAFPKATSVRMEGVGLDAGDCTEVLKNNADELHLQWLDVGELCSAPNVVAQWAHSHKEVTIENIHFTCSCDDPASLRNLLLRAGTSVKTLSITIDDGMQRWAAEAGTHNGCLDFSHNTHLRSLRLLIRLECAEPIDMSWLTDIVTQISSAYLVKVAIYVEVLSDVQLNQVKWGVIDATLADTRLQSLNDVQVCILLRCKGSGPDDLDPSFPEVMKKLFPKLTSRNILHVSQHYA